jgi:hypothetical protein
VPPDNLLLILLLMMLSKDKLMVDGPAKMLLPLLLQSAVGGTQVDINALLPQLLYPQLGLMPADGVTKPPAPSNTPVLSKPSVQLSVAGLGLSTILQALGFVGTPFGMGQNPSDYGTLATLVPANDIVDHDAQHRKARQPRIARRGHAAVVHVRQSRADAAQVARITDIRITERGVGEAAQDVMANAIR